MVPGAREPGGGEKVTLAADRAERRARTIIRAITFDVGGTLLEPWPSVGQVYARVAARLGWGELDPTLLNQRFREAWQRRPAFDYSRAAWAALAEETFAGLGQTWTGDFFTALYDAFAEPEVWRVFDDVRPALEALRRLGLQLAVVSNWDERLRPLLRRLELDDCFESLVISCEAGFTKPAPEIFQRALTELRAARRRPPAGGCRGRSGGGLASGVAGSGLRIRAARTNSFVDGTRSVGAGDGLKRGIRERNPGGSLAYTCAGGLTSGAAGY